VKCSAIAPVWKWVGWSDSDSPAIWAIILGAVLRLTLAPSQHYSPAGQEHGRTIPLAAIV